MKKWILRSELIVTLSLVSSLAGSGRAAAQAELTFAELRKIILEQQLGSVNETLRALGRDPRYSHLLQDPVLNPRSFALHAADVSARFPRIVLHDRNFVLQVTGDPRKESGEIIESLEFRAADRRFHFQLVNFLARETGEMFVENAESTDFRRLRHPSFSTVLTCNGCHALDGQDTRPRWGAGPYWQTPFGRIQETITAGSRSAADWLAFQSTLQDPTQGERYRLLRPSRTSVLAGGDLRLEDQPNSELTGTLDRMNLSRLARIVTSSPAYPKLRFAVAGTLLGCGDVASFVPPADFARLASSAAASQAQSRDFGLYPLAALDSAKLAAYLARKHSERPGPGQQLLFLKEGDFVSLSRPGQLQVHEKLRAGIEATNLYYLATLLGRPRASSSSGLLDDGLEYESAAGEEALLRQPVGGLPGDVAVLAGLRLLLEPSLGERISNWSTAVAFPFATSYLFPAEQGGIAALFTQELAPPILKEHPELDRFGGQPATAGNLREPLSQYCARLRALSLAVLVDRL